MTTLPVTEEKNQYWEEMKRTLDIKLINHKGHGQAIK